MNLRRILLALVVAASGCLSGCSATDINDLAMVMAVGLDKGPQPNTIQVTAQIARPSDAVGQTGAPSAGTGEPIWTATGTGHSIFEAMRNLARFSSRRVYWAHNKVIVINEDLARTDGINDIIDFFTRNHELRMRTWVVATPNRASELVATKTGLEVVPGTSLEKLFRYTRIVAEAPDIDMRTVQATYLSDKTQVILPIVQIRPRGVESDDNKEFGSMPQVELSGVAYFQKDKLRGVLNSNQSRALMWFVDPPVSRELVLHCPDEAKSNVSLDMKHHRFRVIPSYVHGRVGFTVQLRANFDMVELGCQTKRSNRAVMALLEREADAKLTSEIRSILRVSQTQGTDFLGLADRFQDRYPAEWKLVKADWQDELARADFHVQVSTKIRNPVLLRLPTVSDRPGGTG